MGLYKLMGVAKSASKQEIKQAYRKLALHLHPDKHTKSSEQTRDAAAEKFKQVSAAYETLVDDRKRAAYDRMANATQTHQHERRDNGAAYTAGESRQSYTYENRHGGGGGNTKSDDKKKETTWIQLFLRLGVVIIVGMFEETWHRYVCERECETLRKNHEGEVEEVQKRQQREVEELQKRQERQVKEHGTWLKRYELRVNHERQLEEHRKKHQHQLEEHRKRHERELKDQLERHKREREKRWIKRLQNQNESQ